MDGTKYLEFRSLVDAFAAAATEARSAVGALREWTVREDASQWWRSVRKGDQS